MAALQCSFTARSNLAFKSAVGSNQALRAAVRGPRPYPCPVLPAWRPANAPQTSRCRPSVPPAGRQRAAPLRSSPAGGGEPRAGEAGGGGGLGGALPRLPPRCCRVCCPLFSVPPVLSAGNVLCKQAHMQLQAAALRRSVARAGSGMHGPGCRAVVVDMHAPPLLLPLQHGCPTPASTITAAAGGVQHAPRTLLRESLAVAAAAWLPLPLLTPG